MTRPAASARAWMELFRLPNIATVPGGAAAGYVLGKAAWPTAGFERLAPACAAVTLLYMAGLALNDWADAAIDARERPARPIPSGRLKRGMALAAALLAGAGGVAAAVAGGVACAVVCVALAATAALYNLAAARGSPPGWVLMGACRAMTVLAGAAAAASWGGFAEPGVLAAAATLGAYTVAVSALAAREAESHVPGARRWAAPAVAAAGAAALAGLDFGAEGTLGAFLLAACALRGAVAVAALRGEQPPERVAACIGELIRLMIVLQAGFCLASRLDARIAAVVLVLYPVAKLLGRWFRGS